MKERVTEQSNVIDKLQETIDILNKDREDQKKNYEDQIKIQEKDRKVQKKNYDDQIKIQEKDRKVQKKNHNEQMKKSDEILKNNVDLKKNSKRTKKQLNNITEELVESREKIDNITEELEDNNKITKLIAKKLDIAVEDRVPRSNQSSTIEYLIILKSNTNINNYYIIRGQKRHIKVKIDLLKDYHKIKSIECVPNAITLFNLIKQNMKDNIYCKNNILNLININEDDFLEKIDNIYDERKIIEINN